MQRERDAAEDEREPLEDRVRNETEGGILLRADRILEVYYLVVSAQYNHFNWFIGVIY